MIHLWGNHVQHQARHSANDYLPAQPGKISQTSQGHQKPLILTVNGKAEAIVQDAEAYQRLLDSAAQADPLEGILQSVEDMKKGRVRPARQALAAFRRFHEMPR
jgi:hypothetical protein